MKLFAPDANREMSRYHRAYAMLAGSGPQIRTAAKKSAPRRKEAEKRLDDLLRLNRMAVKRLKKAVAQAQAPASSPSTSSS